jgi:hypothetical protein
MGIALLKILDAEANSQTNCVVLVINWRRKLQEAGGMVSVHQMIGSDLVQRLSATSRQASPDYLVAARLTLESLLRRPDCLAGARAQEGRLRAHAAVRR